MDLEDQYFSPGRRTSPLTRRTEGSSDDPISEQATATSTRGHPVYESHDEIVYAAENAGPKGRELLRVDDAPEVRAIVDRWTVCVSH